jgi:hypothetical protein
VTSPPLKMTVSRNQDLYGVSLPKPLGASPSLTADRVDKMYHQLLEIHAIATTQQVECSRSLRSDSTSSPFQAGTGRPKPIAMPSTIRSALSPSIVFSSQAPPWWQDHCGEPQARCQACRGGEGALLERHRQSSWHEGSGDSFRSMFEELRDITTQRATSYEVIMLCPAQGSREVTPSSDKEELSDVVAQCTQEGVKGGGKRCRQCLQETTTIRDDGHDWEVGSSGVRHTSVDVHSVKCPMRPPTDHFKRLLEEACPNHTYLVRHKLKDYEMMRSFMTLGSYTWGTMIDKEPVRSDTSPFPEENAVMMVYWGRPLSGRRRIPRLSRMTPPCCGWGHGAEGCDDTSFFLSK